MFTTIGQLHVYTGNKEFGSNHYSYTITMPGEFNQNMVLSNSLINVFVYYIGQVS